ncbi:cytochrome c oxidase accessory protein CcoG [Planctomycetaceae bacterium SH139]
MCSSSPSTSLSDDAGKPGALPVTGGGAGGCGKCGTCKCGDAREQQSAVEGADATGGAQGSTLLGAPLHVLSTLEQDGSRRWLSPKLSTGVLWKRRRVVAYALIAIFVLLPHLRWGGKPLVLLDIVARRFVLFGHTFLPTDTLLLALGMVAVFLTIVLATAISGRLWCGWGCPQTVYMEFLFRPIDRLFEGTVGKGGKAKRELTLPMRFLRWGIYLVLSMALAHTFLSYFVGTERLAEWVRSSPVEHPAAFALMIGTTAAMLFDFLFFREQLCLIACPYGRFQSVMLDRRSRIVGYDVARGEPRHKGKRKLASTAADPQPVGVSASASGGDCVDCNQCVVVCPTGIDIRDGLQMECINCTQCIDACNEVMDRVGLPQGLIRYTSQDELAGKPGGLLRARTILYPLALAVVVGGFLLVLSTKYAFDAGVSRSGGHPYTLDAAGMLRNNMSLRLMNRSDQPQTYKIEAIAPAGVELQIVDSSGLELGVGENSTVPVSVRFPTRLTAASGFADAEFRITDGADNERKLEYRLLGPKQ